MRTFAFAFVIVLSAVAAAGPTNVTSTFSTLVSTSNNVITQTKQETGTSFSHSRLVDIATHQASVTSTWDNFYGDTWRLLFSMSLAHSASGTSQAEAVRRVSFDLVSPHFYTFDARRMADLSSEPVAYLVDDQFNGYGYTDQGPAVFSGLLPAGRYELFLSASHVASSAGPSYRSTNAVVFLTLTPAPVPEPGTMSLALGVAWLLRLRRAKVR